MISVPHDLLGSIRRFTLPYMAAYLHHLLGSPVRTRRRAAHFAHFNGDDGDDGGSGAGSGNVHVGSNEARNLGPWSSAVELVNARQQAQAEREGECGGNG